MNINHGIGKVIAWSALLVATGAIVVACGGGGGMGGGANNPPAPAATRDVNISCGAGAGEAMLSGTNPVTATATLTGNQQVPPVCTGANGTGTVTVDTTTRAISGSIMLDGIATVTAAHIHDAAAGANGAIIITLVQDMTTLTKWNVPAGAMLTAQQVTDFNNGNLYFNAHTQANPNGEVRGQIGRSVYTAAMTSAQERLADGAAKASTATGTGIVVVDPSTMNMTASFHVSGLSSASTVAHIHSPAAAGAAANPLFTMPETSAGSGTFTTSQTLTAQQMTDLTSGNMYFNVHTMNSPGGEIRGQIGRAVRVSEPFSAVSGIMSAGSGSGFAFLDVATRTFNGSMTINNITPTAAHIHESATGSVVVPFTVSGSMSPFSASATNQSASATVVGEFLNDATYMNVHTMLYPSGEIMGQLDIP